MSVEYPSDRSNKPESRLARLRTGLRSVVSSTMTALRVRFYSLRFGDWFSIVLTLAVVAIAGTAFAGSAGAALTVGVGLSIALTLVMTNSSNPLITSFGVAAGMLTGGLAVGLVAFVLYILLQTGFSGLFAAIGLFALVLASIGAFLAPVRSISRRAIARSILVLTAGIVGIVGLILMLVLPRAELRQLASAAGVATAQSVVSVALSVDPIHAFATFFVLVAAALFFAGRIVVRLPVERLLPADRRSTVVGIIGWVQRWRSTLVRGSLVAAMISGMALLLNETVPPNQEAAWLLEYTQLFRTDAIITVAPPPLGELLVAVVSSQPLRVGLYAVIFGSIGLLLTVRLLGALRRGLAWTAVKLAAPLVGGIIASIPFGFVASSLGAIELLIEAAPGGTPPELLEFLQTVPSFVAGAVVVIVLLGLCVSTLSVLGALATVIVLPANTGSPTLASIGLFGVALATVVAGLPLVGIAVAAAALCVWDVGEFGATIRTELPGRVPILRAETVHTSGSLLYCSAGAIGAWLLYRVAVPQIQPPATEIAAVGLLGSLSVAALLALLLTRS